MVLSMLLALLAVGAHGQTSTSYTPIPTLPSSIRSAPTQVPNIYDQSAPDSQVQCPGYVANNVEQTDTGVTADLTLAGPACNTYGVDITELSLLVEYQDTSRLHVQITPKYLAPANRTQFFLPEFVSGYPSVLEHEGNDLAFEWTNEPDFQFQVKRVSNGDVLFSTYGQKIVYQNQFLELATSMVDNYDVYGLAENIHDFRLGNNYTQIYWAADAGNTVDMNVYGTHPLYIETRYSNDSSPSMAHGVYARNAHAQEWLLRSDNITYRTIGGAFDFYFLSGSTPKDVVKQYQQGIVGTPVMQMYWTFGFHQSRWGYQNWSRLQEVVDTYKAFNIPLECIWTDIDYMDQYRDFTNGAMNFPVEAGQEFLAGLHASNQHYVPIVDSNIYAPDPTNGSDVYEPFTRGANMNAFIRNGDEGFYYGDNWPGFSVWGDWLVDQSGEFWTYELSDWYTRIPFDGIWIDLNEASSFCAGSCGTGELAVNPVHPPFALPGDPGNFDYQYPEAFNITNATEAASASAASSSQAASNSATMTSTSSSSSAFTRSSPTATARNLRFPPYVINNVQGALEVNAISPNATHNDPYNSTEYDFHNVFGHQILNATYNALVNIFPGRRPFILGRSTFAGSGTIASHWGGDNTATWGSMYLSISQALTFSLAGIPMFGADTCGFTHNTDYELCTRWMALSAFFPFYRNHNVFAAIDQEAYVWEATATSARNAMQIRYSLLPYMYTLFNDAHTSAEMVMRPLQFEFPNDASLKAVNSQFLLGPSVLVTPVLVPLATNASGVFPGVGDGEIWYDWYSLQAEEVASGENKTLAAPLTHINVHGRGGTIFPLQEPGYTTEASRQNPWEWLVLLDCNGEASGHLYLDDGESIMPNATKEVELSYKDGMLTSTVMGQYEQTQRLQNVTVAGLKAKPESVVVEGTDCYANDGMSVEYDKGVLRVTGLDTVLTQGAYAKDVEVMIK